MKRFVGLDVSQATTAICVVDADGKTLAEGVTATEPAPSPHSCAGVRPMPSGSAWRRDRCPSGSGTSSGRAGLPAICIEARHAKAA